MCRLLFKGVRLINGVVVHYIYTTAPHLFFLPPPFPSTDKLFNDKTSKSI